MANFAAQPTKILVFACWGSPFLNVHDIPVHMAMVRTARRYLKAIFKAQQTDNPATATVPGWVG